MSDYRSAVGFNIALGSLAKVNPQPFSPGVKATRRISLGDGSVLDQGLYVEWIYSVVEDSGQLYEILTPLGLHTAKYANVTINTRDDLYIYRRYNGVAVRPESSWDNYFVRNVTIVIKNLKVLA